MKKNLRICMIILLIILYFSCRKNVNKENNQEVSAVNGGSQEIPVVNYPVEKDDDGCVYCYTNITDNNVNVRLLPSLEGKIIYKLQNNDIVYVFGFSNEMMTIDDYNGNWVYIYFKPSESEYIEGWVFSKYVNIGDKKPLPIKFIEMMPNKEKPVNVKLSYNLEGEEIFVKSYFEDMGEYYLIIWDTARFGYHYKNIPGIYFLSKDTFELKHFTYSGTFADGGVAWTEFTDDFEYVIQDSGTSSGIRGITAWKRSTNEKVYQGIYYKNSWVIDHTIDVVYMYDDWYYERGFTDDEIMQYGKKFMEENQEPESIKEGRKEGLHVEVIVRCKINLDTGERTIIKGDYIPSQ
jgi:hypothetical protein